MKTTAKIVCCFALACFYTVSAGAETTNSTSATEVEATSTDQATGSDSADASLVIGDDNGSVTSDQKIPVVAQPEDVDQVKVERRLEEKAARTKQRIVEAEKDVADRNAQAQRSGTGGAAK